jgi:hypothetical protein
MSTKWEYKVVFVEGWERVSMEGQETHPEEGERNSAFGRRMLNGLGADGWELAGIQHAMPGRSYLVFKRPLADGAEPDLSVVRHERPARPEAPPAPKDSDGGPQVVSV